MAKIRDLEISSLKIANNSFTRIYQPYSGGFGTDRYIDIDFEGIDAPVLIWVENDYGTQLLYWNWISIADPGAELLFRAEGYMRVVIGDMRPAGTHTYALRSLGSGSGRIVGAVKRYR